ncbi:MAG: cation:proton antiporter [Bdellovibrionota bacterium]
MAALVTLLFRRLGQPVVLGYVAAGMIVGPHIPIPLVANAQVVSVLAELGAILIMLAVGLEFRLTHLFQKGLPLAFIALFELFTMFWLGFSIGTLFGWTDRECVFAGSVIAITSTPLVIKALSDQGVRGAVPELVVGVSLFEDLIGILLIAILSATPVSEAFSAQIALPALAKLFAFLVGVLVAGFLVMPWLAKVVVAQGSPEATIITAVGFGFALAFLAREFGYSTALGAFLAGSLLAESGESPRILPSVQPVRDVFAAVFFVSVGMLIDPALLLKYWAPVAVLSLAVIAGKFLSVCLGAFLAGNPVRDSVQLGLSFGQIGEFALIIAGIGLSSGGTREFLYPITASICMVSTLTTPYLIRASPRAAAFIDRKLPRPLQTFTSLYGTWFAALKGGSKGATSPRSYLRRMAAYLLLDALALGFFVAGSALLSHRVVELTAGFGIPGEFAWIGIAAGVAAVGAPLTVGLIILTGRIATTLAHSAFPKPAEGRLDRAIAPRRALRVTLQFAILLLIFLPLLFVAQLALPPFFALPAVLVLCLASAIYFWRSAKNLEGHVRAGVLVIAEVLGSGVAATNQEGALAEAQELLAGMGSPEPVSLPPASPVLEKSLGEVNLRGLTGATVLAIFRGREGRESVQMPGAREILRAGDTLVLTGSPDAIASAKRLLLAPTVESISDEVAFTKEDLNDHR